MKKFSRFLLGVVLVSASALQLFAQYSQTLSLGRSTLYSVPSANLSLRVSTPLRMVTASYFLEVGGVTFEAIARPTPGTTISQISVRYEPSNVDGSRLLVWLDGQQLVAPVYDWQFIPTARFADEPYTACFTLFGDPEDLRNKGVQRHVEDNHGRVIRFAPAFKDSLVGLRLMQMDMLIISPDATELPKLGSQYVLGLGEVRPDVTNNTRAAKLIEDHLSGLQEANGRPPFDSYVFNDQHTNVYVSSNGNHLALTGTPSYYTFRYSGPNMENARVVPNTTLNTWLSGQKSLLRSINPSVWDTAVTTSRYAAFFRYVKQQNPDSWRSFLSQIRRVTTPPNIQTPDVVIDPREKEMADMEAAFRDMLNQRAKKHP